MKNKTILMPQLEGLENVTITVVDPKGQNESNAKEKLIEAGYTLVFKNTEWDKLSHSLLEKSINKQ
jgi:hypothetical protein